MYPTSSVTFILGNGEEVVVRTYGSDSCVHVEVHAHACVCVCVCVCVCIHNNTHTHISSCNNTPSANTRNDVTTPSKYFLMANMIVLQQLQIFCTK